MMRERWKPVTGYEGVYSVSDRGRVRRDLARTCGKAGAILKTSLRNGYPMVNLSKDGVAVCTSVHTIVASAFLGVRPAGLVINHKDGKRTNPRATNLEYGTQGHNCCEAYRLGLRDARGEGNGKAILNAKHVRAIRREYAGVRGQQAALARKFGVSSTTIRNIVSGARWSHVR